MSRGKMEMMARLPSPLHAQRGTTLLEVLITIVILAIGLLGLAGLQARLQSSEMEAYQRSQALILLNDMASRIATNRANALAYVTVSPLGVGASVCGDTSTRQKADACEWSNALQGAGETLGGNNIGAMVGGRGCIQSLNSTDFMVTVAWQGLTPVAEPPDSVTCGLNQYDGGTACVGDLCRRTVTTIVRIGNLAS